MRGRRRRRVHHDELSAEGDGSGDSVMDIVPKVHHERFKDYLEQNYYALARPTYGLIHRVVVFLAFHYALTVMIIEKFLWDEPGAGWSFRDYYPDVVANTYTAGVAFLALIASWFYFIARRHFDWKWDEVIESMYEPEKAQRLREAAKHAREWLDADLESESLREQFS